MGYCELQKNYSQSQCDLTFNQWLSLRLEKLYQEQKQIIQNYKENENAKSKKNVCKY